MDGSVGALVSVAAEMSGYVASGGRRVVDGGNRPGTKTIRNEKMWPAIFLCAGILLLGSEAFLPTFGIAGILGFCSLVAAIVTAWMVSPSLGIGIFVGLFVCIPPAAWMFVRLLPKTRLGKRLIPCPTLAEVEPEDDPKERLRELIGCYGTARTPMLPSGLIEVDGATYDAVADGTAIESGQSVRVTEVRTRRLMVIPATPPSRDANPLEHDVFGGTPVS